MVVFLNPVFKSTVTIKDERVYYAKQTIGGGGSVVLVDNVPTILAFTASITSYLGYTLVNLVDTSFANTSLNGTRFSDVGFMTNFRFLARERGTSYGEGNGTAQMREKKVMLKFSKFVEKCVIPYEQLTGESLSGFEIGGTNLTDWDPATWTNYDRVRFLEAERGVSCKDYWNQVKQDFQATETEYQERVAESMGINIMSGRPALEAMAKSVLAAPTNVAGKASNMIGIAQYQLRASLDGVVAAAKYADSLGVTGANAEAINQGLLSASAKMSDVTSQVRFLFSADTLPDALHFIIGLLYAVFPILLVVVAIRGYPDGLKILYYFMGGMLSMEMVKMSLALVHNIVSYVTSVDGATLLHAAAANGVVDYDKVIHGYAYYQYMAKQATLAADIGTAAIFMIPMVVATGQVKLLGSILGSAVSQHAPNTTVQSANTEMAKANDAENRDRNSVVAAYSTAAVMQGIEANNAAIAALSKMDLYNDYNKGQVGQQMQQIGSTAGYGSELNSSQDFQNVLSGGKFQGVQSASNMKSLGREFESDQDFKYSENTTGRALARTLGNDATAKTIGSARGLIAGDFFDKDGNLRGGREGNLYTQGLENQSRISANQTAGVGKLGELTRSEMNAIQYGSQAGALGQIAQGRALQSVHGTGANFEESYNKTAYMNAHQSLSQQKGSAQAYNSETHGGAIKTAESMGRVSNALALRSHTASVGAAGSEENIIAANAGDAAEKTLSQTVSHGVKAALDARNRNGSLNLESEATTGMMAQAMKDAGAFVGNAENTVSNFQKSLETMKDKTDSEYNENYVKDTNSTATFARFSASNPMKRLEDISNLPLTAEGTEGANWQEFKKGIEAENERLNDAKTQADNAFNAGMGGDFAQAGKLSSVQNYTLGVAGTTGTFNASGGFVQGGTQSGVSLSHNTQHSYSSGITTNGGSLFAASATQMGFSADGFAAGSSAIAAAGQVAGVAAMVLPGGVMGRTLSNIGMISSESAYAMGIGASSAASSKNAASALSGANAYMEKAVSFADSTNLGQLRSNYEFAQRGFSNVALSGNPKDIMNARSAMEKAHKAYQGAINKQRSLERQYNALSPEARELVDKNMGGYAGGGVTKGLQHTP